MLYDPFMLMTNEHLFKLIVLHFRMTVKIGNQSASIPNEPFLPQGAYYCMLNANFDLISGSTEASPSINAVSRRSYRMPRRPGYHNDSMLKKQSTVCIEACTYNNKRLPCSLL